MKRITYFLIILTIGLTACNSKIDFSKMIPAKIDKFATGFISEIHKGNIDTCLTMILPEMNNEKGREFLTNTYKNIQSFSIDSFNIINANQRSLLGDNGFTDYGIDYEYKVGNKFLYFSIGVRELNEQLKITAFDGRIMEDSLSKVHMFTFENKGFWHHLFLFFAVLIPIFIIITLIFAIRTKLTKKWLWIIGILFGFIRFSINWTTGQIGFSLINFAILGAGITKSGNIAPWILSFSIPIVGIIFWIKRFKEKKKSETQINSNENIISQENIDKLE